MHLPGSQGAVVEEGLVSFAGSMSMSRSLKVSSAISFERISAGGSNAGRFISVAVFLLAVILL